MASLMYYPCKNQFLFIIHDIRNGTITMDWSVASQLMYILQHILAMRCQGSKDVMEESLNEIKRDVTLNFHYVEQ